MEPKSHARPSAPEAFTGCPKSGGVAVDRHQHVSLQDDKEPLGPVGQCRWESWGEVTAAQVVGDASTTDVVALAKPQGQSNQVTGNPALLLSADTMVCPLEGCGVVVCHCLFFFPFLRTTIRHTNA